MAIGNEYEQRVRDQYRRRGALWVRSNVTKRVRLPDGGKATCELDLVYFSLVSFETRYVECKYRSRATIDLEEVATFTAMLDLLGIPKRKGEMVVNTQYTKRAVAFADLQGILLYRLPV